MLPLKHSTQTGGIVAVANVIGCVKSLEGGFEILWKVEGRHAEVCDAATSMWFVGPFGYVLADVKPVPFFPCKGSLGFFNVDMEVQP